MSLILLLCGTPFAAPATLTQSVTYNSETITLRLTKENLRGPNFELKSQNATGGYDDMTPVDERSYIGTVDGYPGAVSCGVLLDSGQFKGAVYFDRGPTWFTLDTAVIDTRGLDHAVDVFTAYHYPTAPSVTEGQAGADMYRYDVGVDAEYDYFNLRGSSDIAKTFELIEYSVAITRAIYMRDTLMRMYLGRVIIRADQLQDPYKDLTAGIDYLTTGRGIWNIDTDPDHDVLAIVMRSLGGGVAWKGIGTGNAVSLSDSGSDGSFSVVWRHEMGHNWGLGHWVGGYPEGNGLMGGNQPGRFSGCEVYGILTYRADRIAAGGILDNEGTYDAIDLPPYAAMDAAKVEYNTTSSVTIDVLGNDFDANADAISISGFDAVSANGAAISLSAGTGPGGRDELTYTLGNEILEDHFLYTIVDSTGQTATGAAAVYVDLPDTLKGYWKLDETTGTTAADASIFGSDATTRGGLDFGVTSVAGPFGGAVDLDGVDDALAVSGLNIYSNTVTITAWIKRNGTPSGWNGLVFSRAYQAAGLNFGNSTELRYHWNGTNWGWDSGLNVPDNTWTFVALVIEPTKATIYMNDGGTTQSAVRNATHTPDSLSDTTYIGREANEGRFFKGAMDDVRIYDYSLTAAQIQQLIAGGGAESPTPFDGKVDVALPRLRWVPGAAATEYDVYIGSNAAAVASATQASAEYAGTTTATQFIPALDTLTQYYWRVDTVTASQTLTGTVWTFTTADQMDEYDPNLVAHWKLDDGTGTTVTDSGPYGYDGTLTGATWITDQGGGALDFTAANSDTVSIPAATFETVSDAISVALWANGDAAILPNSNSVLYAQDASGDRVLNIHLPWGTSRVYWDAGNSGTVSYDRINKVATEADFEGQWNHWVFTKDAATGQMKIYLNGVLWHSGTGMTRTIGGITSASIGSLLGTANFYDGAIDDVRIYDFAMNDTEVSDLHTNGRTMINLLPDFPDPFDGDPAMEGMAYHSDLASVVTDPEGGPLTFSMIDGPAWISVASDGSVTGTPESPDIGTPSVTVQAVDELGGTRQEDMSIEVHNLYRGDRGLADFAMFASQWLSTGCVDFPPCGGCDLDGDTDVDMDDLNAFAGHWLDGQIVPTCLP